MTDKLDLDAIEARAAVATSGLWWTGMHDGFSYVVEWPESDSHPVAQRLIRPDAEFIAHARTDVPALLAEVRRLRAALAEKPVADRGAVLLAILRAMLANGPTLKSGEAAERFTDAVMGVVEDKVTVQAEQRERDAQIAESHELTTEDERYLIRDDLIRDEGLDVSYTSGYDLAVFKIAAAIRRSGNYA